MNDCTTDFEWTAERLSHERIRIVRELSERISAPGLQVLPANTLIEVNGTLVRLKQPVLVESA